MLENLKIIFDATAQIFAFFVLPVLCLLAITLVARRIMRGPDAPTYGTHLCDNLQCKKESHSHSY